MKRYGAVLAIIVMIAGCMLTQCTVDDFLQGMYAKRAVEDQDSKSREFAVSMLTDHHQSLLAKIAVEDKDSGIRKKAVMKLTDQNQALLAKITVEDEDSGVRKAAVMKLTDQELLATIAVDDKDTQVREAAVSKLTDQELLASIAVDDIYAQIRKAAAKKLTDQELLAKIAVEDKDYNIRLIIIMRLTDQKTLEYLASSDPSAEIRLTAIHNIKDSDFLETRSKNDDSLQIRLAAIYNITDEEALLRIATTHYGTKERNAASNKINKSKEKQTAIKSFNKTLVEKVKIAESTQGDEAIIDTALKGDFDVIRQAAAKTASIYATKQIAISSTDHDVSKIALTNLDLLDCEIVSKEAKTPEMRLAATVKSGKLTWAKAFSAAMSQKDNKAALGDLLAAVALFSSLQPDAQKAVIQSCVTLIKRGDESRIPEMVVLLENYGDTALAEDYLNCGQPDLYNAAEEWGRKQGYSISSGNGSHRAKWGVQ